MRPTASAYDGQVRLRTIVDRLCVVWESDVVRVALWVVLGLGFFAVAFLVVFAFWIGSQLHF